MIQKFNDIYPKLAADVFIAPDSWVIGDVKLASEVSIFFGAVLRGDLLPISVGARSNIQEHAVLHTTGGKSPTIVGDSVTIGHRAIIHGCSIGNNCLIGMGSIILDGTIIGNNCLIGAGSVIPENKTIPDNSLVYGNPYKVVRTLTLEEVSKITSSADGYVKLGQRYLLEFTER